MYHLGVLLGEKKHGIPGSYGPFSSVTYLVNQHEFTGAAPPGDQGYVNLAKQMTDILT